MEVSHPQLEVCLYQIRRTCPHPCLPERGCFCCLHADTHQERDVCKAHFWKSVRLVMIILSSSLWPLASFMVLLCAALRPFFTAFQLCWLPSFLCWSHSLLPQGLCICSSLCLPCSSFPRVVVFSRPLFTLLFRVPFSKRPPSVRPQAPSCHHSYPLAFFFIIFLPLPRIPSSVCMCRKRREGREFIPLASSLLRPWHLTVAFSARTPVFVECMCG